VTPQQFEAQVRYLRDAGFRSVTLDEWRRAKERWQPLPGRAILITVDDGFRDFAEYAWPILRRYGFTALVFVVPDHVGGTNRWDEGVAPTAPLLGWKEIRRLAADGVQFGSHTASHPYLTALTPTDVVKQAARSRAELVRELGIPITALAYPHGAEDEAIQHLVGACGYVYGLSCRPGPSNLWDPLLALPRIAVTADTTSEQFIAGLKS
jgi:peptidoglycan/xylan/chitin deacetylase (PgdA/CDA1 family)